ncbi:MAG: hypothetical protein PHP61_02785 [Candidatus Izemoplasmatales bacterium]|jgi:hypothetical protein|nr:hypothetical protein [Candidatus Izemoplasmatales bacterium]MDD4354810.1 hypothetical protein [Candidatus Izemoplasmatales bacterium]MDD4988293.1 hypothetical protein [Candidatus Izemoplasmatales bacterium]MDD5602270.1 hypothetical protein [Candidatus Izemoplasmatales bacterium]MDY0372997.1 hypothetical protein [Candidatus Izemoplasmatales bacterium]
MKKLFNILGQVFGFLTILLFAFLFANTVFDFGIDSGIIGVLELIKTYAVFVVCGLAGFEFVAGKKLIGFIYFVILAFVIVFSFFPDVRDQIVNIITTMIV